MGPIELLLFATAPVSGAACCAAAWHVARARQRCVAARAERDRAAMAEAATMRALRLAVADIRGDAMRLLGYAERLVPPDAEPSSDVAGVLAMTQQLLDHADDMQDYAVPEATTRRIAPETIPLRPLIDDAVAQVAATLGPSVRHWRIGPVGDAALLADRRALGHVLTRVLANAARRSRPDDSIDIRVERWPAGLSLSIEDEGAGLLAARRRLEPAAPDSRGIGLGLVMARVLMEAHGGLLSIESAARIGTKVTLSFPAHRVASPGARGTARCLRAAPGDATFRPMAKPPRARRPRGNDPEPTPGFGDGDDARAIEMFAPKLPAPGADQFLTGQLLIAMPAMGDPRFARTVVYMCAHTLDGAMGLVINRPIAKPSFADLLGQLKIEPSPPNRDVRLCAGGPVDAGRGFVLHTSDWSGEGSLKVDDSLALTASLDVLKAIAGGGGPRECLLALGYAGWGPGQLDREIQENAWLSGPADEALLFDGAHGTKWTRAMAKLKVDPLALSDVAGHA